MNTIAEYPSAHLCSTGYFALRTYQAQTPLVIFCAEDHALTLQTGEFCRLQVCDNQNLLPDHLFRCVPLLDPGQDLACFGSDLHLAAEKFP